jgi:hypothetical protein
MRVPLGVSHFAYVDVIDMLSRGLITEDEARDACLLLLNQRMLWVDSEQGGLQVEKDES